jgi:hypothetical protein
MTDFEGQRGSFQRKKRLGEKFETPTPGCHTPFDTKAPSGYISVKFLRDERQIIKELYYN